MHTPPKAAAWFALTCLACAAIPASCWALRLSTTDLELAPTGRHGTQTITLDNNSKEKISVQLQAFHRGISIDGQETRTPTDEFGISPAKTTIAPHGKESVNVSWNGDTDPDEELAYRLVITDYPSDSRQKRAFLMQNVASLYVVPAEAEPEIGVESFKVLSDGKGELILKNSGTAHGVLKGLEVFFKLPSGARVQAAKSALSDLEGETILAGGERRVDLTVPSSVVRAEKARPLSVVVSLKLKRA